MSKVGVLTWLAAIGLPVAGLWLLISHPELDARYEHHPQHFWLVLAAAALAMALGVILFRAARVRHDLRLVLVSLMFQFAAGFLRLHAIATPGVIIAMPNAGFVYAVPVGLTLGGIAALASAFEYGPVAAARLNRLMWLLSALPALAAVAWAMFSLTGLPPFDGMPNATETSRSLVVVAYAGSLCYLIAAVVYARQFARRRGLLLLSVLSAYVLLIEALLAVGYGRSWQASWWEWHALMVAAFGLIALSAHVQFRREGSALGLFDSVTLNQTMAALERGGATGLAEVPGRRQYRPGPGRQYRCRADAQLHRDRRHHQSRGPARGRRATRGRGDRTAHPGTARPARRRAGAGRDRGEGPQGTGQLLRAARRAMTESALLQSLTPEERRRVLASCLPRRFKRREILCHEGDPGDTLHLVKSGLLLIRVTTSLGSTATLTMVVPGDSFGELAVRSPDARRTATVEAAENAETLTLSRSQLESLRAANPGIDNMLTVTLVEQIRRLSATVLEALYLPVESRVIRRLAYLARIYGGPAPIAEIRLTQDDLASMAGTTRATANRVLRELEQRGIVSLRRGRIIVTDRARLSAAATA
ncbi:Crp/Fnr family transcriptional regulator [Nocardia seriolae]|uniref:Cyclic nucleotide-binding domain-containing protein n=2 Tax=Nocardia seriolae TaxID=37332 RepID=A0ABC9Z4H7_9NOCA|nr:Crp/Fnr family transcriptional regulator [Nocardia seriolae]BEK98821.1 hypothetical protein NSER024013_67270 [Nocardia seriolae]GAM50449.1 hypothetical protein NS07_v2contig00153-0012 [Nocardia seriolae]GAP32418.1 hypothetical protein NSK11_contig00157-0009 [Nocardia seriolae]